MERAQPTFKNNTYVVRRQYRDPDTGMLLKSLVFASYYVMPGDEILYGPCPVQDACDFSNDLRR